MAAPGDRGRACDRLRPVLLTTLTTVLGLHAAAVRSPRRRKFLKPTVITLVYGLGFGMVLVLVVVPALLAAGQDIAGSLRAARRALSGRARPARLPVAMLAAALVLWGGATLVAQAGLGRMLLPLPDVPGGMGAAFGVFAAGAVALTGFALVAVSLVGAGVRRHSA